MPHLLLLEDGTRREYRGMLASLERETRDDSKLNLPPIQAEILFTWEKRDMTTQQREVVEELIQALTLRFVVTTGALMSRLGESDAALGFLIDRTKRDIRYEVEEHIKLFLKKGAAA